MASNPNMARPAAGERNPRAKLTEADVRAIRVDCRPLKIIGRQYGLRWDYVCLLRKGRHWAHLKDDAA